LFFSKCLVVLICLFLLCSTTLSHKIRVRRGPSEEKKAPAQGTVAWMLGMLHKYEDFAKTKFGAFMNGFFLGLLDNVTNDNSHASCQDSTFWKIMHCFVGDAEQSLEQYFNDVSNFRNLPDTSEGSLQEASTNGEQVLGDSKVQQALNNEPEDKSNKGLLSRTWDWLKGKVQSIFEYVKGKITGFWDKIHAFLDNPLVHGARKIGGCVISVAKGELNHEAGLAETVGFMGKGFLETIKTVILNSPFIIKKIYQMIKGLYSTWKKTYSSDALKYYDYGKEVEKAFYEIFKIVATARRMRRFRRVFSEIRRKFR